MPSASISETTTISVEEMTQAEETLENTDPIPTLTAEKVELE
jgi:hypothetical protein